MTEVCYALQEHALTTFWNFLIVTLYFVKMVSELV
jgi:hypothetical protein